jgi:hypothetical protein
MYLLQHLTQIQKRGKNMKVFENNQLSETHS